MSIINVKNLTFRYDGSNPLVLAEELQIKYDNKDIFNPTSFEVNNGDRIAIVGKNGAGKSSILKLILEKSNKVLKKKKL